jgi:hypothetical protein
LFALFACGSGASSTPSARAEPPPATSTAPSGGEATPTGEPDNNAAEAARGLAGPGAADCGSTAWSTDRSTVDECVVATVRGGARPFYARYETRVNDVTGDLETVEYLVRDGSGTVYRLRTDPAPVGSDGAHLRVHRIPCVEPHIATFDGKERLTCRAYAPDN